MSDKRGYVKSSAGVGDAEPMAASDVAFLAPELVSEAEGPVPVPAPAEGRLGYRFVKRVFDIAFSACAIAVLLVPSIVLCIAIRLESPGCPIYSQKRVGRIGRSGEVRTFDMYKFRSMHKDADERLAELQELNEADGPLFKIKDDPRVTRIGKFIRKHSMASVIIGTPGDGESTKSLSRSANSSLDLQLCERRPGLCCFARTQYKRFQFLSVVVFRDARGVFNRTFTRISSLVPSAPLRGYAEGCSSFLSISKAVRCNDGGECCRRVA
ncbi:sugar transferase [Eggerthella lenta]|uniref:sugar transferase n=1 Tax=Eggerthella lenta TaxID=84112 RepID=UPI001E536113|nr:sugar transferase [Eggerthella lenta]MDB1756705.1 sugar transferase [Eggerthella lenta]